MIANISKIFEFDSAHRLTGLEGKEQNIHGHGYKLVVTINGEVDPITGMVLDPRVFQEAVSHILYSGWFKGEKIIPFDHSLMLHGSDPILEAIVASQAHISFNEKIRVIICVEQPTAEHLAHLFIKLIDGELQHVLMKEDGDKRPCVSRVEVWETADECAAVDVYTIEEDILEEEE